MEEIIVIGMGLIFGSFLNVIIYRLPLEMSIVRPHSHCTACGRPVKPWDNIPVISFIILSGRCRFCYSEISLRYPMVELFTGFTFWLCWIYYHTDMIYMVFSVIFLCLLVTLALIDYDWQILPDSLTKGGGGLFLLYSFFNPVLAPVQAFLAAGSAVMVFAGLYIFYLKVRRIEGLGQGDIKMMLLLGAFLGPVKLVMAVLIASLAGLLVGVFFILFRGKTLHMKLPFGTFLSLGSYIALFWGDRIFMAIQAGLF